MMAGADALAFVASAKMHVPPSKIADYLAFDRPLVARRPARGRACRLSQPPMCLCTSPAGRRATPLPVPAQAALPRRVSLNCATNCNEA